MSQVPFWIRWRRVLRRHPKLYQRLGQMRARAGHAWRWLFRRLLPARSHFGPPKGWFSLVEKVRTGEVRGRVLFERQPENAPAATRLRRLALLGQQQQTRWPFFWSHHANARLIGPTLLLQDERRRVAVESAYGPSFVEDDPGYRQFRRPPAVRLNGAWTSVISRWSPGFYHWFMDALPRLALLAELPPETRIIVPAQLTAYHRDTLEWLGLTARVRPTGEEHLVIDDYYFSAPTNITGHFDPYAIAFLRRSFLERRDRSFDSPRRFYVQRVRAVRGVANDAEVADFFRARGWAVVDMETLSLAQQIQLFAQAEEICALHGAALTNLVWCRPGCRVLELLPSTYLNGVYEGVAEAVQADYDFLLCPGDTEMKALVNLKELAAKLRD